MKLARKTIILISAAALAASAAIAIPIGVVFGTKSNNFVQTEFVEKPAIQITKNTSLSTKYEFGKDPYSFSAPALSAVESADFANYQAGYLLSTSLSPTTAVGDKKATATFSYRPKPANRNLATINVTWFVDTVKGSATKGFGTNNNGRVAVVWPVLKGTATYAEFEKDPVYPNAKWIEAWRIHNGYGAYVLKASTSTAPNPVFGKEDNSTVAETALKDLALKDYVLGKYTFELDTTRYNNPSSFVTTGVLSAYYTIGKEGLYKGKLQYQTVSIQAGDKAPSDFEPVILPERANDFASYVVAKEYTTYEVTRSADNLLGPWEGDKLVNLDNVSKYGAGTMIRVTYYFKPIGEIGGPYIITTKILSIKQPQAAT